MRNTYSQVMSNLQILITITPDSNRVMLLKMIKSYVSDLYEENLELRQDDALNAAEEKNQKLMEILDKLLIKLN